MDTLEAIYARRAVKHHDADHVMPQEDFDKLFQVATQAPTSFNIQPARRVGFCLVLGLLLASCTDSGQGAGPPPVAPAPAVGAPPPAGSTAAPPVATSGTGWRESVEGVAIPETPAAGRIHGRPFTVEAATWENGIITMRMGDDFFADASVTIFTFQDEGGAQPAGKSWAVDCTSAAAGSTPHVHLGWREEGGDLPETDIRTDCYAMQLQVGPVDEKTWTMPGQIYLCVPDEQKSWVAGAFAMTLEGLRRRSDGSVDMTGDSFDTLKQAARVYLAGDDAPETVEITEREGLRYTHPAPGSDRPQTGQAELAYRVGEDDTVHRAKVQFIKGDDGWRVHGLLEKHQVFEAHPVVALEPPPASAAFQYFGMLAGQWLEAQLAKEAPGHGVSGVHISTSYGAVGASASIRYTLEGRAESMERRLALKKDDLTWSVVRELEPGEKVHAATGEIRRE